MERVLRFLGVSGWLLSAYRRFVMRHHDEPLIPYLVACGVLGYLGLRMRAAERAATGRV